MVRNLVLCLALIALAAAPARADDVADLQQQQAKQAEKFQLLNRLNPFSGDFARGQPGAAPSPGPSAEPAPQPSDAAQAEASFAKLRDLLSNPAVQSYLRFFANPAFTEGATRLVQNPRIRPLAYAEMGWLLLIIVLRAWRMSKARTWTHRLWVRAWTLLVAWVGALFFVPWAVLGMDYYKIVVGVIEVLRQK